jgi:hypothetical protein
VLELFDLLCKALRQGRSLMGAPITCPQIVLTDERTALTALEVRSNFCIMNAAAVTFSGYVTVLWHRLRSICTPFSVRTLTAIDSP